MMGIPGLPELPPAPKDSPGRKTCCAAMYELEPVRLLLGETLHPGGLALTHRLGKLMGVRRDDLVLDVACGRGASALALSRSFHCKVVGTDLGSAVSEAARVARESGMSGRASFVRGDAESLPLRDETFDAALCECSMSLFPDKERGVMEMTRLLRSGGNLGVSDVTVEPGCLPEELRGSLGQMLCLADAPPVDGYRALLSGGGLTLVHQEEASDSVLNLVGDVEAKLAAFRLLLSAGGGAAGTSAADPISRALAIIEKVKALVREGAIGYWLFVAKKGDTPA